MTRQVRGHLDCMVVHPPTVLQGRMGHQSLPPGYGGTFVLGPADGMERRTQAAAYAARLRPIRDDPTYGRGARDLGTLCPRTETPVAGILHAMDDDGTTLENLSRGECLRLVGQVAVGRIVYTRQALPAVELVNFTLDDGDIVIRTDSGGKLAAATRGAVVAFEADSLDTAAHAGWSVTIIGYSRAVTGTDEIRRLEQVGLVPWAPGKRDHCIRISPTIVNGRRLAARQWTGDSDASCV